MAVVAQGFTHFDRTFKKGDELDDTDPLVALAPHLFEQKSARKKSAATASPKKERP